MTDRGQPSAPAAPRPIIVLGPERSGTSVVAEMVHRWGAYAGEPELLRDADERNPQGYWEYLPIWDFLEELGDLSRGASWWDPAFQDLVAERASDPAYRDQALALVDRMETEGCPWVWKDPALSFYLPFWMQIWTDPVYIITVRNPIDVAASWRRFVTPPGKEFPSSLIDAYLLRWHYIMLLILEHTEGAADTIYVPYEGVIQDPKTHALKLGRFLNRCCVAGPAS